MILEHYQASPVLAVSSRQQDHTVNRYNKPIGFWVSVKGEDDWPSWCESEHFRTETLSHRHVVTLSDKANILFIPSAQALDEFNEQYHVRGPTPWSSGINWTMVAEYYDGIIIAPYHWERRLSDHCGWYYGWDCASGCIWNADAIASIDLVKELVV